MISAPKLEANNANQAGALRSNKVFFGENGRYAIYCVHQRQFLYEMEPEAWMVADAETPDEYGFATIVAQESSFDAAMKVISKRAK